VREGWEGYVREWGKNYIDEQGDIGCFSRLLRSKKKEALRAKRDTMT